MNLVGVLQKDLDYLNEVKSRFLIKKDILLYDLIDSLIINCYLAKTKSKEFEVILNYIFILFYEKKVNSNIHYGIVMDIENLYIKLNKKRKHAL